ncbi:MAG TPA: RNA-binding S4 domain-containing protein [Clostridia bacterium]|nr:RNA-binding S4 domain-containing protein [Clostridia bacterium]
METVYIDTETIKLEQFLKFCGEAGTGGNAKIIIHEGLVKVNGEVEKRRGKKLKDEDVVEFENRKYKIEHNKK